MEGQGPVTLDPMDAKLPQLIDWLHKRLEPATIPEIGQFLDKIATTLDCNVPDEEAIEMYFHALRNFPNAVFKRSVIRFLKTYSYRRFPLPADLVKACVADSEYQSLSRALNMANALAWKKRFYGSKTNAG